MNLKSLSCEDLRPNNKRGIARCMVEISSSISESVANKLTEILLEGNAVDIMFSDKN